MSDRRNRPPNRWGCKPVEDVCVQHDRPLVCRHGCEKMAPHQCKDLVGGAWIGQDTPTSPAGGNE
jgi:hypothetical protein